MIDGLIASRDFLTAQERELNEAFLARGYVIAPASDAGALNRIREFIVARTAEYLGVRPSEDDGAFLDAIGSRVTGDRLNDLRLHLIASCIAEPWFREAYYSCGRDLLGALVGNELAMQRGIGLSIQLPGDRGSVLPLHSDAWSEDSPFELVLWIPLVDCLRTKSMFLLPPEQDAHWRDRVAEFSTGGVEALYRAVEPHLQWLEIPYGNVLLFTHTLMHGNRMNEEPTSRWSMNVRFKGLFTPYSDKRLGDFFEPITIRAATRVGMTYRLPSGFDAED